jgi:hypothetical protein
MMRAPIFALFAGTLCAQISVDPAQLGELPARLESSEAGSLRCEISELPPALNFSLRFEAAYTVRVPLSQFQGQGHQLSILLRVRPEAGGTPVYFVEQFRMPDAPVEASQRVEAAGGYLLGLGRYSTRALVYDEAGRTCRHEWTSDAHLSPGQRGVHISMPPNTVAGLSQAHATEAAVGPPALGSLTIFLDAAPLSPRMSTLPAQDVVTLVGALSSLLEQVPANSVRLVVFSLDLQKELFRQDSFTTAGIAPVEEALNALQLGTVDYHILQNRGGHLALLADLVNRERHAEAPSDAVVFLGPRVRYQDKVAPEQVEGPPGKPAFYEIQFRHVMQLRPPPDIVNMPMGRGRGLGGASPNAAGGRGGRGAGGSGGRPMADNTDTITLLVSHLKGKTFLVQSPADFAKAIHRIRSAGS